MVERARQARGSEAAGLASWEGTVVERISVGLATPEISRERGLYRGDRAARVRWDSAGRETVRWLGIRRRVPVAGDRAEVETDGDEDISTFPLDPVGDRLNLGGSSFVHPLAPDAERDYRYEMGDSTRIVLPDAGREIILVEVRVAPRRSEFDLLAGSLWFDRETAALVRGAFRPARPFDLQIDEPEDAEDVPGFLKPITLTVEVMVVDYGLYELRWWLPTRVRFEGEGRVGSLFRLPLAVETTVSDVTVNEPGLDPDFPLPDGWTRSVLDPCDDSPPERGRRRRREQPDSAAAPAPGADTVLVPEPPPVVCPDGGERERIVILPPPETLEEWWSSEEAREIADEGDAFDDEELARIVGRIREVAVPPAPAPAPELRLGAFRYNRVEALSAGVRGALPLGAAATLDAEARIGVADLEPNLTLALARAVPGGELRLSGYWRLASAGDWGDPFSLRSSAHAFLLGYDDGQYYRSGGISLSWAGGDEVRGRARVFAETQRDAPKETDASLPHWISGVDLPENVTADEGEYLGFEARLRAQAGRDPERPVFAGTIRAEAATGDLSYLRAAATGSVRAPVSRHVAAGIEISAGGSAGLVPAQRQWFLGGVETLRAFPGGAVRGTAFWLGRAELATRDPGLRVLGFADVGWAGDRRDVRFDDPSISVGAGVSALDGLLRLDVARSLRGREPDAWRVYVAFDGLL